MAFENIQLEELEAGIHLITVNRPKVLNALNLQTVKEIEAAVQAVDASAEARVLLISGAGDRAFVAGADIRELSSAGALEAKDWSAVAHRAFRALEKLRTPTIAVVHGFCLGAGCELALSCDWVLASDKAVFGLPEVNLGVMPGAGGTQRLTRLVGRAKALELITTGRNVKAEEALSMGLANHVYPVEKLMEEALAMARSIASKGPVAVRLAKEAIQRGQDLDLDNACVLENDIFAVLFATADQKEGMAAFVEKRSPKFRGC